MRRCVSFVRPPHRFTALPRSLLLSPLSRSPLSPPSACLLSPEKTPGLPLIYDNAEVDNGIHYWVLAFINFDVARLFFEEKGKFA